MGKRRRATAGEESRGGAQGNPPEKVKLVFSVSVWAEVWPGTISTTWLIHPCT